MWLDREADRRGISRSALIAEYCREGLRRDREDELAAETDAARRLGDVLDFVAGALVCAPAWFLSTFTPPMLLAVVVLTPLLHVATNAGAYLLGLKDEPDC